MPRTRNPVFEELERGPGIYVPGVSFFSNDPEGMALDAQPSLITTANAGIPAMLTTTIDPKVIEILLAPNQAAEVLGEQRKGDWVDQTWMFTLVESTGQVESYGDYQNAGRSNVNFDFPQRQSYMFQTGIEYGDLECDRASKAKIPLAAQKQKAAAKLLKKFMNYSYLYGIAGLQNYGLVNDPSLSAPIAPSLKNLGGVTWFTNGYPNATGQEVYNDIVSLVQLIITQANGLLDTKSKFTLVLSPQSEVALTFTNTFNVNVATLLKTNFPNMEVKTVVQYGQVSATDPQGITAGNLVQLIAHEVDGNETGYCAYNELMRAHRLIPAESSYKQKWTCGTWGAIILQPFAIAQMLGV